MSMVKQWKLQLQYQQVTSTLIAPITCFKPFSWFSVLRCHIPRTDRHRLRSVRVRPHLVKSTFAAAYSKPLLCTVIIKETSPTLHTITTFGFCWNHLPVLFWWCPDDLTSNAKELKNYYLHRYLLTYQNEPQKKRWTRELLFDVVDGRTNAQLLLGENINLWIKDLQLPLIRRVL